MDRRSFLNAGQQSVEQTSSPSIMRSMASGLQPYNGAWTKSEVIHLLKRTMFGASQKDITYFLSKGAAAAVDELLNPVAPMPAPPLKNYTNTTTPATDADFSVAAGQTWVDTYTADGTVQSNRRTSFRSWWMGVMLNQDRSIREKMTLFWHNHFATEANDIGTARYVYKHHKLLRDNCLGNVKTLVRAMSIDPAMLTYLNGQLNTRTAPDENYARELQELFTLGKENDPNYTEDDVKTAARVLTGWRNDANKNASYFDATRHDTTDKVFSSFYGNRVIKGKTGAAAGDAELDELLDMIFSKSVEVSRYIVTRLYRWFVYYEIDAYTKANVIDPLAAKLRSGNWEVKPVLSMLLKSEHFHDALNQGCQIKSPVDMIVGLCREFDVIFPDATDHAVQYVHWNYVRNWGALMQQNIGDPPDVSGWKAYYQLPGFYGIWINSDTYPKRNQFSDTMAVSGYTASSKKIIIDHIAYAKTFTNPGDPNVLISDIADHMLQLPLSPTIRNQLKRDILLSGQDQDYYWTNAWNAHIANVADQTALRIVQKRLQDLIKYLMNLPEYQLA
jgi:uncharacterized protein (DUF1800 family)